MSRMPIVALLPLLVGCSRPLNVVLADADYSFKRNAYAAAADDYAEVTTRDPGRWWAHYRLGECLLELKRPNDARRELDIALTLRPHEPRIVEAMAEALYQQGDTAGLYDFLAAEARDTQTVDAYMRWGRFAALMDDPDSAQSAFLRAIEMNGRRSVDPYLVAATFAQDLGDFDEALRLLGEAHRIDPSDRRVRQRLSELGEVPGPTFAAPGGP